MIKKYVYIIIFAAMLILLLLYMENKYHVLYNNACGMGIQGLKVIGMIAVITMMTLIIFSRGKNKTKETYCIKCLSKLQKNWKICPNCGWERIGDN
ncbi:hypothetical protein [Fonticella tunisiensis]|uniref:Uncharacterized protein n=1 Tax=Fonticella tunisiensis TaxID=1096341 RepID=A0A4R7KV48_9CLOT|nr:hypothetical protein [Fonticella tunisiensis]TDT63634.1 hypothetical protein EDD71_10159 [Fonticella tunisiensis]